METALDPRKRPSIKRNGNGACNFFIGSPTDEIRAGRVSKERAADLVCERVDCGKTWAEHYSYTVPKPKAGTRRY